MLLVIGVGCGGAHRTAPNLANVNYLEPERRSLVVSCQASSGTTVGDDGSLVVPLSGDAECRTEEFRIGEGHHSAWMDVEFRGLNLSPSLTLSDLLDVRLQIVDVHAQPMPLPVSHKSSIVDGTRLTHTFLGIDDPRVVPESRTVRISLLPAHYPFDTGWIPPGADRGTFLITLRGPGEFLVHSVSIERTKWNMPLSRRLPQNDRSPPTFVARPSVPEARVIASSQGVGSVQDSRLREFGPVLARNGVGIALELRPPDVVSGVLMDEALSRLSFLRSLQKEQSSFEFGALFHPYWEREGWATSEVEISDPSFMANIDRVIRSLVSEGVKFIIIRTDDILPSVSGERFQYQLFSARDRFQFGSLARAHATMMNRVVDIVVREGKETEVFFVPPWYCLSFVDRSQGAGRKYFEELAPILSPLVGIMWTGSSVRSLSIDELEYRRFSAMVGGRQLSLWDNTLYARRHEDFWGMPGPHTVFASHIEPYDVVHGVPYTARKDSEPGSILYLNGGLSERSVAQILTAAEYAYGPRTYHPERAILRALKDVAGVARGALLIQEDSDFWRCKSEKGEECKTEGRPHSINNEGLIVPR